jgi:hypothetical protein
MCYLRHCRAFGIDSACDGTQARIRAGEFGHESRTMQGYFVGLPGMDEMTLRWVDAAISGNSALQINGLNQ